jgi:hypothetical protein
MSWKTIARVAGDKNSVRWYVDPHESFEGNKYTSANASGFAMDHKYPTSYACRTLTSFCSGQRQVSEILAFAGGWKAHRRDPKIDRSKECHRRRTTLPTAPIHAEPIACVRNVKSLAHFTSAVNRHGDTSGPGGKTRAYQQRVTHARAHCHAGADRQRYVWFQGRALGNVAFACPPAVVVTILSPNVAVRPQSAPSTRRNPSIPRVQGDGSRRIVGFRSWLPAAPCNSGALCGSATSAVLECQAQLRRRYVPPRRFIGRALPPTVRRLPGAGPAGSQCCRCRSASGWGRLRNGRSRRGAPRSPKAPTPEPTDPQVRPRAVAGRTLPWWTTAWSTRAVSHHGHAARFGQADQSGGGHRRTRPASKRHGSQEGSPDGRPRFIRRRPGGSRS